MRVKNQNKIKAPIQMEKKPSNSPGNKDFLSKQQELLCYI